MNRENRLFDEERPLPYLVQLARIDGAPAGPTRTQIRPALTWLDLRGGEFSRATMYRLAKTFDRLTRAFSIHRRNLDEYALAITALPPRNGEEVTGERTPYVPEEWPADLQGRSFLWVPTAYDANEETYAWQR